MSHQDDTTRPRYAIAIHGGAGVINSRDESKHAAAKDGLRLSLARGLDVLQRGGCALDAVQAAVVAMEDHPSFNAGRGAVYTAAGTHELEASIMDSELRCGAVCLLKRVRNPIVLARRVMEGTPHIFLCGAPAEAYAEAQGLEMVDNTHFNTPFRHEQLLRYKEVEDSETRGDEIIQPPPPQASPQPPMQTVGAVALDAAGRLAAATSTGGRTNKWEGRIGDTPMIGAGNYASPWCAVSGTGIGEQFIRHVVCHDLAVRMKYLGVPLEEAARQSCRLLAARTITEDLSTVIEHPPDTLQASQTPRTEVTNQVVEEVLLPGDGGVVAVDKAGNIAMPFNSEGMYRGCADSLGRFEVAVFQDDTSGPPP